MDRRYQCIGHAGFARPDTNLGNINSAMNITEATVGHYVLSISSINLNQSALTLSAPAGSTFVLNISGNITLNGGSQGGPAPWPAV